MAKARKSTARDRSVEVAEEPVTKTPKPRGRSVTASAKKRKQSQSRSKSKSRKAEPKPKGRSKTRSRSRSKSPKRKGRPRSQSGSQSEKNTAVTRSRGRSRSRKIDPAVLNELTDVIEHQKKPDLGYRDVLHDDFTLKESKLNEIIRRSISRELSQEKANMYRVPQHTSLLKNLKNVEPKNIDEMNRRHTLTLPQKKRLFSFSAPEWLTALFDLTVFPLIVLTLHLACNQNQCTVSKFHIPLNWKYYINPETMEIIFGFVLVQAILSLLPIGKRVDGPPGINGTLQYRCNGLLSTVLTLGIAAGLWHYQFPVTIVYDNLISLLISSIILAYVFGLLLFIKGGRAPVPGLNPVGIVGNRFHQFLVGREVNPLLFGKLNIKTLLIRTCMNEMLLLNSLLVLKAYEVKHDVSYALVTCVILNALIVIDFFWFENSFPLTFEAMYQGTGCSLSLGYLLYPFLPALITKYIIQHKVELPVWGLVAILIGFPIGFVIYRASSMQKAAFRKCPLNPALTQLEAIPTNRGKKLLVAGWWGWVRHPNYLGTIIFHWAWASASGYSYAIPYAVPLIVTVMLMFRAKRVDSFCSQRYQSAWEEYCSRVRYRIFPRVY